MPIWVSRTGKDWKSQVFGREPHIQPCIIIYVLHKAHDPEPNAPKALHSLLRKWHEFVPVQLLL